MAAARRARAGGQLGRPSGLGAILPAPRLCGLCGGSDRARPLALYAEVYGETSSQALDYVLQKFTTQEKYKLWPQAALHTQWPGKGQRGDDAFDQYFASEVPGMESRIMQTEGTVDDSRSCSIRSAPRSFWCTSQSGAYAWPLAQARPNLVKAIVAAEPAGPPVHDVVVKSVQRFDVGWEKATKQTDDDYFRDNPGVKPYGLSNAPIAYTPTVTSQSPLQFEQQAKPERRDLARCWRQKEPARKLVAVGDRPVMVLEAEASFYAGYNHCNVEYLRQAGVPVTFIKLADPRHSRQWPHDDDGKEQRRYRAGHRRLARQGGHAARAQTASKMKKPKSQLIVPLTARLSPENTQ